MTKSYNGKVIDKHNCAVILRKGGGITRRRGFPDEQLEFNVSCPGQGGILDGLLRSWISLVAGTIDPGTWDF